MKIAFLALALLSCSACQTRIIYRDPPEIPELPDKIKSSCPGLEDIKGRAIVTMALADAQSSGLYAKCQARHEGAVKMYESARTVQKNYMKKKAEIESKSKKKK